MGSIVKRGEGYRAIVRMRGNTVTKTHATRRDAQTWITNTEKNIDDRQVFGGGLTLGQICKKYLTEVLEARPYPVASGQRSMYERFAVDFERTEVRGLTVKWWLDTARGWDVAPASRQRYLMLLCGALKTAHLLWSVSVDWDSYKRARASLQQLKLVDSGRERERRLEPSEYAGLVKLANVSASAIPLMDIINVGLATCLRESEICNLKWSDLNSVKRMIRVRDRKHPTKKIGNDTLLPLLGDSLAIIERQPRVSDRIFPFTGPRVCELFAEWTKRAGIADFHFHDLRHEGISRLFEEGYGIAEVALVSGHKDWKCLRRYVNLKPEALHQGPISRRVAA